MLFNFEASFRENINEIEDLPIQQEEVTPQQIEWLDITTLQQQNDIHWVNIRRR